MMAARFSGNVSSSGEGGELGREIESRQGVVRAVAFKENLKIGRYLEISHRFIKCHPCLGQMAQSTNSKNKKELKPKKKLFQDNQKWTSWHSLPSLE
jgi:hypothetical protein